MRLQEFNQSKADVYVHSSQVLTNNNGTRGGPIRLAKRQTMSPAPQVMVTTDRIVVENYTCVLFFFPDSRIDIKHRFQSYVHRFGEDSPQDDDGP